MIKIVLLIILTLAAYSCGGSNNSESCTYNGHVLYVGEKGGCYYFSSGGNKEYVDKNYCKGCN